MSELTTERLRLADLDLDRDAGDLHVAFADRQVMTPWLGEPPSTDEAQTRQRLTARLDHPGARMWAIRMAGERPALGVVELLGTTGTPGLTWMLRPSHWRRGIMTEAVAAVVAHLFETAPVDRLEAWANSDNFGSLRVAQRNGFTERTRFARRDDLGSLRETVVLGRYRQLAEPRPLFGADVVLPVRDVDATLALLAAGLGFAPGFRIGQPTQYAVARLGPWTNSRGVRLRREDQGAIGPVTVSVDVGVPVADVYARVVAAGLRTDGPPQEQPWGAVEFCCVLPEGHRLEISGRY